MQESTEKQNYLKKIYDCHTDWWRFLKSHADAKAQNDKWWDLAVMEARQISDKYVDTPLKDFSRTLGVQTLSELQQIAKGERF